MLVVGDATGSTSCALGPGVIVTRAAPDAFEETPGRGQLPLEQRQRQSEPRQPLRRVQTQSVETGEAS